MGEYYQEMARKRQGSWEFIFHAFCLLDEVGDIYLEEKDLDEFRVFVMT